MPYSNERKLSLSAWLKNNSRAEYQTPLKLQKFLFFYESFSKVAGEKADFDRLRGYKNGPVFSTVWGDYTKERAAFEIAADRSLAQYGAQINSSRAKQCAFIVATQSEKELSDLTHCMNVWKAKEHLIMSGYYQVPLDEADFNEDDTRIIKTLEKIYPIELVESSKVIDIDNFYFIFNNDDFPKLTAEHIDTLVALAHAGDGSLHNPIFTEFDEDGRLVID